MLHVVYRVYGAHRMSLAKLHNHDFTDVPEGTYAPDHVLRSVDYTCPDILQLLGFPTCMQSTSI